jgi:hypothetical protein
MYSITSVSRRMRWAGYVAGMGKKRNTYKDCGEKNLRKEIISMT